MLDASAVLAGYGLGIGLTALVGYALHKHILRLRLKSTYKKLKQYRLNCNERDAIITRMVKRRFRIEDQVANMRTGYNITRFRALESYITFINNKLLYVEKDAVETFILRQDWFFKV